MLLWKLFSPVVMQLPKLCMHIAGGNANNTTVETILSSSDAAYKNTHDADGNATNPTIETILNSSNAAAKTMHVVGGNVINIAAETFPVAGLNATVAVGSNAPAKTIIGGGNATAVAGSNTLEKIIPVLGAHAAVVVGGTCQNYACCRW